MPSKRHSWRNKDLAGLVYDSSGTLTHCPLDYPEPDICSIESWTGDLRIQLPSRKLCDRPQPLNR